MLNQATKKLNQLDDKYFDDLYQREDFDLCYDTLILTMPQLDKLLADVNAKKKHLKYKNETLNEDERFNLYKTCVNSVNHESDFATSNCYLLNLDTNPITYRPLKLQDVSVIKQAIPYYFANDYKPNDLSLKVLNKVKVLCLDIRKKHLDKSLPYLRKLFKQTDIQIGMLEDLIDNPSLKFISKFPYYQIINLRNIYDKKLLSKYNQDIFLAFDKHQNLHLEMM